MSGAPARWAEPGKPKMRLVCRTTICRGKAIRFKAYTVLVIKGPFEGVRRLIPNGMDYRHQVNKVVVIEPGQVNVGMQVSVNGRILDRLVKRRRRAGGFKIIEGNRGVSVSHQPGACFSPAQSTAMASRCLQLFGTSRPLQPISRDRFRSLPGAHWAVCYSPA